MDDYSQKTPAKSMSMNRENPERSGFRGGTTAGKMRRGDATSPLRKNLTQHEIYSEKA